MGKKKHDDLEDVERELKNNNTLKYTLQRRVPILIKNFDTVELEKVYEEISKLSAVIYTLERKRINLRKDRKGEKNK